MSHLDVHLCSVGVELKFSTNCVILPALGAGNLADAAEQVGETMEFIY